MNQITQNLTFSIANSGEFYEIKHFLKRNNTYSANRDDTIFLVRSGKTLVGIARLLKVNDANDTLWLRGLFISEHWRGKGIATQLLLAVQQHLNKQSNIKTLYAFAEPHLELFYKHNQYKITDAEELPNTLKITYSNALHQGKKWLCLSKKVQ